MRLAEEKDVKAGQLWCCQDNDSLLLVLEDEDGVAWRVLEYIDYDPLSPYLGEVSISAFQIAELISDCHDE